MASWLDPAPTMLCKGLAWPTEGLAFGGPSPFPIQWRREKPEEEPGYTGSGVGVGVSGTGVPEKHLQGMVNRRPPP